MRMIQLGSRSAVLLLLSAALAGCPAGVVGGEEDGTATVHGKVTDDEGFQSFRFGGSGSVSAASSVRAHAVHSDGTTSALAEGDVEADGSYSLEVPAGEEKLVLEAIDEGGEVIASALLETSGAAGESVACTPMTTESSLEAEVFVRMVQQAGDVDDVNPVDLRTRISSRTAAALRDARDAGEDVEEHIRALAEAALAAQRTEIEAYAEAGVETTQHALFEAELSASQSLSAALDDGSESAADAYATFLTALEAAAEEMGATAEERARAESCASVAFRATVAARIDADTTAAERVRTQAILGAAALEARAAGLATDAVLAASDASADVKAEAEASISELRSALALASTTTAAAQAFAELSAALVGDGDVEASVLGAHLDVDVATAVSAQAAVDATLAASASLDAALEAALDSALATTGQVDTTALAEAIVTAYSEYVSAVHAAGAALAGTDSDVETAVDVLIVAEGSYRLGG